MSSKMLTTDHKQTLNFEVLRKLWGIQGYEMDHINTLKDREKNRLQFKFQSRQLEHRASVVDMIKNVAEVKKLQNTTIHLAVYILDNFMDNYDIILEKLLLTGLVALSLATKFEEQNSNSLKPSEFNVFMEYKYSMKDYQALEILMLRLINWYMNFPTAVHFIYVYLEHTFSPDDSDYEKIYHRDFWNNVLHILNDYLEVVLDDLMLMQTMPSQVAAAIIALTRNKIGCTEIWPDRLVRTTGFELEEMKSIISSFNRITSKKKNKAT